MNIAAIITLLMVVLGSINQSDFAADCSLENRGMPSEQNQGLFAISRFKLLQTCAIRR